MHGPHLCEQERPEGTSAGSVVAAFLERVARHPDRVALRALAAGGAAVEEEVTWGEWANASARFGASLLAAGHVPGERVAVLAANGLPWPVADLGILMAGGVSVGLYPTSAPAQVRQVLADCGAVAVVVDGPEQLGKVMAVRAELPALRVVIAAGAAAGAETQTWEEWQERGADALRDRGARAGLAGRGAGAADDDALLIYTSGSTGEPKGARITHRYLLSSAASIASTLGLTEADTALSFLPFCHAAERVFGLYTRIACGMEAALLSDHGHVWKAAEAYGPTVFGGLPRFYEKVYEALRAEQLTATGGDRERWERVLRLGRDRSARRRAGGVVPPAVEAEWLRAGAPLFARVRSRFGGRVRVATSGGAALPAEVAEYLDALGLTVLGAYGLTEHLCATFNRPDRYTFDSAGTPMPGAELKLASDSEILIRRGALTFAGYHGRPEETREAFTPDGRWLRTGDLGVIDASGFLRVTGRKKELIALSTGKKVAPLPIEARLASEPWISQAVLYGEGRKFITALLVPRRDVVEEWARAREVMLPYRELLLRPDLQAEVQQAVERVNALLSRPERVRRFVLLDRELTQEQGELTATLKVRRAVIAERFGPQLDTLYQSLP